MRTVNFHTTSGDRRLTFQTGRSGYFGPRRRG